ncbi:MAG: MFS transporter [Waddliaceae bacterium]
MSFLKELFNWKQPKLYNPEHWICDWLIVFTLTILSTYVIFDLVVTFVLLTEIQGYLMIDDTKSAWIGKAFFFMNAFAPLYAVYLAKTQGFKLLLFVGTVLFFFGSILTGFATNYTVMLVFRSIGGAGGGIILANSLGMISHAIPETMRNRALTVYSNIFFGLGIASALLVGGYIGQLYHWRAAYTGNLYAVIPFLLWILLFLPETEKIKLPPYDFLSLFSLATFFFCLLLIVTQAKAPWNTMGWHSTFIIGCGLCGLLALIIFAIATLTVETPLVNVHLFRHLRYSIGCLGIVIVGFMVFGGTVVMISLLETVYLFERLTIGWFVGMIGFIYLLFGIIPIIFANMLQPRVFILIGLSLVIISCFMYQKLTIQSDKWEIGTYQAIMSIGIALILGPLTVVSLSVLTPEEIPKGTALFSFLRMIAATFGSAIIKMIMAIREPFHSLRFGEQVVVNSARFEQEFRALSQYIIQNASSAPVKGRDQATQLLIAYINQQARISALTDALYILGWATFILTFIIIFIILSRIWRERFSGLQIFRRGMQKAEL